ncbi:Transposase [Phytophthora palmivora]|uniref:Transposase n=1 Tax=Phytophthora palmivora TaxID=4796 RepID=A0A2P4Y132_9STRA|nr:Transposase [Phytophthora palmivora]
MLFDSIVDTVYVDEKLFYITQPTRRFFLLPDEATPVRRLRSKQYITKVMFLYAVGRIRSGPITEQVFDGRLGIGSFVEVVHAQPNYYSVLLSNQLPALRSRWPGATSDTPISIQQDNAPAHIPVDDAEYAEATAASERNAALLNQPPSSHDVNYNGLVFFQLLNQSNVKSVCCGVLGTIAAHH